LSTPSVEALNIALRGGAVVVLLPIAWRLFFDYPRVNAARLGSAFAVGVAGFVVSSFPGFTDQPYAWHAPIVILSSGNAIVFWLFTRALFEDEFRFASWHAAVWVMLAIAGLANCFVFMPAHAPIAGLIGAGLTLSVFGFAIAALIQSMATLKADLVEGRRRFRVVLVASIGIYTVFMTVATLASGRDALATLESVANALGIAVLSVVAASQLLRVRNAGLFELPSVNPVEIATTMPAAEPPAPELVAALNRLMSVNRVYEQQSLTVGTLALKMDLPEHKLRRLINQGLGYRNFNTFLNHYRVEAAKAALAGVKQSGVSILTLAQEVGFQSIGPFNRAFKAATGMTPTEFRRGQLPPDPTEMGAAHLTQSIAESENR
jgi:AraC-like DNA-binding protein